MGKQSLIDKAIAQLEGEIEILNLAITKLKAQQQPKQVQLEQIERKRKAKGSRLAAVKAEQSA